MVFTGKENNCKSAVAAEAAGGDNKMNNRGKLILILVLILSVVVLVLQNMVPVQVRFLWLRGELPVALLLFLTAAAAFIAGSSAAILSKSAGEEKKAK